MKYLTKLMSKVLFCCLLAGSVLFGAMTVQAEDEELPDYSTANMDIVDGEEIIMPASSLGAVVDGYQLNHDYVKILNINNGPIVINDEKYTQNGAAEPWSSQEDAYVIKGKGTCANNITITPTKNDIYVYLIDLNWSGQISVSGSSTAQVHLIVCGSCVNTNAGQSIYNGRTTGKLYVEGLTPDRENTFTSSSSFLYDYATATTVNSGKEMYINNLNIKTMYLVIKNTVKVGKNYVYYSNKLLSLNNIEVHNTAPYAANGYVTVKMKDSFINKLGLLINEMILDNCEIKDISSSLAGCKVTATDSDVNYTINITSAIYNLIRSTLWLNGTAQSAFTKINMTDSCLYCANYYTGTPVDNSANDLYLKKVRLREFPNTYVWVSVDQGMPARLRTDSNGSLYLYVKSGTTSISAVTEDGLEYGAVFLPTNGTDDRATNLLPVQKSSPAIIGTCGNQNLLVGEKLNIAINAEPGTSEGSLTYQWYKDGSIIIGACGPNYFVPEAVSRDSGVYKCAVKEDGGGIVVSDSIYVAVSKPAAPNQPVITSQTASMELTQGDSVTLVAAARPAVSGDTLTYQWYKDEAAIQGAQSDSLILANIQSEQAGSYYCIVTETEFNTTIESIPAVISMRK